MLVVRPCDTTVLCAEVRRVPKIVHFLVEVGGGVHLNACVEVDFEWILPLLVLLLLVVPDLIDSNLCLVVALIGFVWSAPVPYLFEFGIVQVLP